MKDIYDKLSDKEIKVVSELFDKGRKTYSEIAKNTGLTRQTVVKIINKMEKNKIIWGYAPILDYKAFGKKIFIALIKTNMSIDIKDILYTIKKSQKFCSELNDVRLMTAALYHGEFDILITLLANDIIEAKKFVQICKSNHPEVFSDINIIEQLVNIKLGGFNNPNYDRDVKELL